MCEESEIKFLFREIISPARSQTRKFRYADRQISVMIFTRLWNQLNVGRRGPRPSAVQGNGNFLVPEYLEPSNSDVFLSTSIVQGFAAYF
jgi:hypothetical protein